MPTLDHPTTRGSVTADRYRLDPPDTAGFRAAVQRAGVDEATWEALCGEARIPTAGPHTVHELDLLAEVVKTRPGPLGVIGRSLAVRVTTFHTLSSLNGVLR